MSADLTDHLGYWLRFVSNHVTQGFALRLQARDVTVAEWVLLRLLLDADRAPSHLADAMGLTRGAISKLATRLEARGLLRRAPDAADGRGQSLRLTDAGRALVPELAALADANEADCFGHLTAEDRATLDRLLRGIAAQRGLSGIPTT